MRNINLFKWNFKKWGMVRAIIIVFILAIAFFIVEVAYSAAPSPFIGQWEAIDVDGSDIRLTIAGPPQGPFQITWTENYFGFCGGEAGIAGVWHAGCRRGQELGRIGLDHPLARTGRSPPTVGRSLGRAEHTGPGALPNQGD